MLLRTHETIVAIASAAGEGVRGVVRVTGPTAIARAGDWFVSQGAEVGSLQRARVVPGEALLNDHGDRLPGDLYVWPGARSYTRQPTLEFHTLGSPPLLALLVQAICRHGARVAEPGEFTLRAFLAGRLDLTQAEAVLGVIDADSRTELEVALRQLAGGLAGPLSRIRSELLDLLAELEAGLDFSEEDLQFISQHNLCAQLARSHEELAELAGRMATRATASSEYRVVLVGRPNAGKSSLLNALAQSQQAIVSEIAGTTRDYLTASIDCGGLVCEVIDTAGIGDGEEDEKEESTIDSAAQTAAQQQWREAHLRLLCLDAARPLDSWEQAEQARPDARLIVVRTKCDLAMEHPPAGGVATSSRTGAGIAALKETIAARLATLGGEASGVVPPTAARCRDSLERAQQALAAAWEAATTQAGNELVAGDVRVTLEELGRIAGVVHTDDVLDRIFSRFCIGK